MSASACFLSAAAALSSLTLFQVTILTLEIFQVTISFTLFLTLLKAGNFILGIIQEVRKLIILINWITHPVEGRPW